MSQPVVNKLVAPYRLAADDLRENPEQWQAYESKGNCVVLAGPGSGKTKTLTIKMARMLTEDVRQPRGIACITYNSECAGELKRRLERLAIPQGRNVFIGTIHAFCLKNVVLPYARLAGLNIPDDVTIALPSEQEKIFESAFVKTLGPNASPYGWRTDFDKYRRTHVDRDALSWRTDNEHLADMIETYESMLRGKHLVDFDDMVLVGLRLIEGHGWVRHCIRARFPIFVVDEYQDLGLPLHRIVTALCFGGGGVRLFAVGDPDQSIYGFTGANPDLLRELSELPDVERVQLRFNYRSGQRIIDASEVALGEERGYKSKDNQAGTVTFHKCPNGLKEQAQRICEMIVPAALERREGRKLGDVAVLYLDKNDGDMVEEAVRKTNRKFVRIDGGAPYRKTPLLRWLEDCAAWCAGGWRTGSPSLSTLIQEWQGLNPSVRAEAGQYQLKLRLVRFLFSNRLPDLAARDWLARVQNEMLSETLGREISLRDERLAFEGLLRVCEAGNRLADLSVAALGGQGGSPEHLNLITLHSAKGLEFDVVVMMGMDQGRIPSWAARTPEAKREPRRLFYVGLTRARHEVYMTFSGFTVNRSGQRFDQGPSEFLIEVYKRLKQDEEAKKQ
jgi:DNA helicase-2/ATP-dependent DNA helicase PcrA